MQTEEIKVKPRHRFEYAVFSAFTLLLRLSPFLKSRTRGSLLALLFRKLSKRYDRLVKHNLGLAFKEAADKDIVALQKRVYRHFARVFLELMFVFVKRKPGKILPEIEVKNIGHIVNARQKNKGVIIFSAHFGNWELIPYILSRQLNLKIASIAREMDNPLIEQRVQDFREFMGSRVINKKNSIRTILNTLADNQVALFLIDQHTIAREAVFVDFFAERVRAVPSVAGLHIKWQIPLVPLFVHYEQDKVVLEILPEIRFQGSGDQKADIRELTQQCTGIIENEIRKYPHQWFWFHNRFKTR